MIEQMWRRWIRMLVRHALGSGGGRASDQSCPGYCFISWHRSEHEYLLWSWYGIPHAESSLSPFNLANLGPSMGSQEMFSASLHLRPIAFSSSPVPQPSLSQHEYKSQVPMGGKVTMEDLTCMLWHSPLCLWKPLDARKISMDSLFCGNIKEPE